MTFKLNHEQAAFLRYCNTDFKWRPLNDAGFLEDNLEYFALTSSGKESLAEYDREWMMVNTSDLRTLLEIAEHTLERARGKAMDSEEESFYKSQDDFLVKMWSEVRGKP